MRVVPKSQTHATMPMSKKLRKLVSSKRPTTTRVELGAGMLLMYGLWQD